MNDMKKFYLIYQYHDDFVYEFDNLEDCNEYANRLKKEFKYDSDFRYSIVEGVVIETNKR